MKFPRYPALVLTSAALLFSAQAFADHNSKNGEGWANMPNDIHNTRIETRGDDDADALKTQARQQDQTKQRDQVRQQDRIHQETAAAQGGDQLRTRESVQTRQSSRVRQSVGGGGGRSQSGTRKGGGRGH
jgi:hypothetical protein